MAEQDIDLPLNTTPTYTATHVFSTADITGKFDGTTQGDILPGEVPIIDFTAVPKITKDGVELFPINSEFGFIVTDFVGAVEKTFDGNPEYAEGWAGDLKGAAGEQLGLVVSDSPTDIFLTPAKLGTWLVGMGGESIKASTEHYSVMQALLSDQKFPGDPDALYPLDDSLTVIGGTYDGMDLVDAIAAAGDVNGDGTADIKDVLAPNETTITENIAVGDDYSITLKDDGKLLYRWGNAIKKPNDIRMETEIATPDEWKADVSPTTGLQPLFIVTQAELVVRHTITNNPNDQIRPEDYENEAATGRLPTYEIDSQGRWVSTDDYYAGDGTFYPAGTVLRDPALADAAAASELAAIGSMSSDLVGGFTNAWYQTMDREPFEPVLNEDGTAYEVGPRWRLKADKYGQDLPSVVIPDDPSLPPPPTKDEVKYEVGADTQTVINLLDWNGVSPLTTSMGWLNAAGTVSANGMKYSENFDIAFYVKGDQKPATLYDATLVMTYEEAVIHAEGSTINGTIDDDVLAGQGGNIFTGFGGEDLFILSYGKTENNYVINSTITDFTVGEDVIGLYGLDVNADNFDETVTQMVVGDDLQIFLDGFQVATLEGITEELDIDSFQVLTQQYGAVASALIIGTDDDDVLTGDEFANTIYGLDGNDTIFGLEDNDTLYGGDGDDTLDGGAGNDVLRGADGNDILRGLGGNDSMVGGLGNDSLYGGGGNDRVLGGAGDDYLNGMLGNDTIIGGFGKDVMMGDLGNDVFVFELATQSTATRRDTIMDFTTGSDIVDLALIDANTIAGGDQAFAFIGNAAFSALGAASAGELRFTTDGTNGTLEGDVDGNGTIDFAVLFQNVTTMTGVDFIL